VIVDGSASGILPFLDLDRKWEERP
jgi:hypothetical protein